MGEEDDDLDAFQYRGIAPLPPTSPTDEPMSPTSPFQHTYPDPRGTSVHRVSMDYFDPVGVQALRRRSVSSNLTHDLRPSMGIMPLTPLGGIRDVEEEPRRHLSAAPSHTTLVAKEGRQEKKNRPLASTSEESLDTLDSIDVPTDLKEGTFDFEKSLYSFMRG